MNSVLAQPTQQRQAAVTHRPDDLSESTALLDGPDVTATGTAPEWFVAQKREAWERFEALPLPARTDETWRFSPLAKLDLSPYRAGVTPDTETLKALSLRSRGLQETAGRMVFVNDLPAEVPTLRSDLAARGVVWLPLDQAAREYPEILREHFLRNPAMLGGGKFPSLHKAFATVGGVLVVPANVEIAEPFEIFHWLSGEGACIFPHTLIVAGSNSRVTLVEHLLSGSPGDPGFACGVNDLVLDAGSKVQHIRIQNFNRKTLAFQANDTRVGRDAHALVLTLNLGADYARSESVSHLDAPGGRSDMLAVTPADGSRQIDQRTLQDHQAPNTSSDLLYKNALDDNSRTIFSGLIKVERGAHQTDAYQKVRNLLLSDDAEANSLPGLEILADQVRCTHGATSGQVDPEEMFYLRSRGLDADAARRLITTGFLAEVFERLNNPTLQDFLRNELDHATPAPERL